MSQEPLTGPEPPELAAGSAVSDHRLLAAAHGGDELAVGRLCDRHGATLFSLALMVLADREDAEAVVVQALADACVQPDLCRAGYGVRHELGRLVYLRCTRPRRDLGSRSPGTADAAAAAPCGIARLLCPEERAALALSLFGKHDYRASAELLSVSAARASALLRSALRRLGQPGVT